MALVDGFGRLFRQVFMAPGGSSCVRVVEKKEIRVLLQPLDLLGTKTILV